MSSELNLVDGRGFPYDQRRGKKAQKSLKSRRSHKHGATRRHGDHHVPSGYLGVREIRKYIVGGRQYGPGEYSAMMSVLTGPMPTKPLAMPAPRVVQAAPSAPVKYSKQSKHGSKGSVNAQKPAAAQSARKPKLNGPVRLATR